MACAVQDIKGINMADGQKYATGKYNRCNDDMDGGAGTCVPEEVGSVGGVATHMTHLRHLGALDFLCQTKA